MQTLVPLGVDIVHVSSWDYGVGVRNDYPEGSYPAKVIRDALPASVPVIAVGGIRRPEQALAALSDGIELVAMGQELLLDPEWAVKVRKGREDMLVTKATTIEEVEALDIPPLMRPYAARFFVQN